MSPQIVTGAFTYWTLDSYKRISLAFISSILYHIVFLLQILVVFHNYLIGPAMGALGCSKRNGAAVDGDKQT